MHSLIFPVLRCHQRGSVVFCSLSSAGNDVCLVTCRAVNDGGVGTREALTLLVDEDESAARDETEGGGIEAPTAEVPVMAVLELTSFSLDRAATVIRCLSCAKLRMAFSDRRMDVRRGMAPVESFGMAFSAIRPTATYLISRLVTPPKTLECSKHSQASP